MANGIKIGTNNISGIKIGTADVDAVCIGDTLVYSGVTPPTPTGVTCQDLYFPVGTQFTASTQDPYVLIPYEGVSPNDIVIVDGGPYLSLSSIDSSFINLDIINSPSDGDYDSVEVTINGETCDIISVEFTDGGGGGLVSIPYGTDMSQYYGRNISRFVINDTTYTYSSYVMISFGQYGMDGYIQVGNWGVSSQGVFSGVNSLPIDATPMTTTTLGSWNYNNGTTNPFNDLQIEFSS